MSSFGGTYEVSMSYLKLGRYSAEPGCREETMV